MVFHSIAGALTFLKGSGLPNRMKYYEGEWKKLREFIEQREREFFHPECKHDVHILVGRIEKMYEEIKWDIAANTPDAYVSVGHVGKKVQPSDDTLGHSLPKRLSFNSKALSDEPGHLERLASEKTNKISTAATQKADGLSSMATDRLENASSGVQEKVSEAQRLAIKAEKLVSDVRGDAVDAARQEEHAVDRIKERRS